MTDQEPGDCRAGRHPRPGKMPSKFKVTRPEQFLHGRMQSGFRVDKTTAVALVGLVATVTGFVDS
ncbi:MAG: hypothetical protein WEA11_00490, partial [Acidimicrobiales bacterium]